jgi:hypothetical protein
MVVIYSIFSSIFMNEPMVFVIITTTIRLGLAVRSDGYCRRSVKLFPVVSLGLDSDAYNSNYL